MALFPMKNENFPCKAFRFCQNCAAIICPSFDGWICKFSNRRWPPMIYRHPQYPHGNAPIWGNRNWGNRKGCPYNFGRYRRGRACPCPNCPAPISDFLIRKELWMALFPMINENSPCEAFRFCQIQKSWSGRKLTWHDLTVVGANSFAHPRRARRINSPLRSAKTFLKIADLYDSKIQFNVKKLKNHGNTLGSEGISPSVTV